MKQIILALLKAQLEMSNAKKNGVNPHFKSKFADLNSVREAVTPLLNKNGIVVLQPMVTVDGNEYVKTVLLHESGESIESFTKILCKSQNNPQDYGSGVTYARRYGLQSLLSIGADDDDGNAAAKEPTVKEAIAEMKAQTVLSNVANIWSKYKQFQTVDSFVAAKDEMKIKLTPNE
jgi:hypothetical protein